MNKMPRCGRLLILVGVVPLFFIWLTTSTRAQSNAPAYREDQILIQPKAGIGRIVLDNFHRAQKSAVLRTFERMGRLQVLSVPKGETVAGLIAKYQKSGLVEFAEPDYLYHADATLPDDPKFVDGTLWGLYNYGQSNGVAHADIDATEGWDVLTSASNIVVAVLDSGIWATHEDLAANMWVSPYDGGNGFNGFTGTNNSTDDYGHGTIIAGCWVPWATMARVSPAWRGGCR